MSKVTVTFDPNVLTAITRFDFRKALENAKQELADKASAVSMEDFARVCAYYHMLDYMDKGEVTHDDE
jgi:hypothetical protein